MTSLSRLEAVFLDVFQSFILKLGKRNLVLVSKDSHQNLIAGFSLAFLVFALFEM